MSVFLTIVGGTSLFLIYAIYDELRWRAYVKRRDTADAKNPFIQQAKRDQLSATYPGCPHGFMRCVALCSCYPTKVPSRAFVEARAKLLESGTDEKNDPRRTAGNISMSEVYARMR